MELASTRILYIEDNAADRMAFEREAREAGFPFHTDFASSLRESEEMLQSHTYQAVVSDFFLGDGNAMDLFTFLQDAPLIIITGEGSEEMAVKALKAGAYDYLIKDLHYNYLKIMPITVTKTIERKKQRDELYQYRTELERLVEVRTNELFALVEKVRESETNFRNIFNGTSDGMFISDKELNILEVNETFLKMFGINKDFVASNSLLTYILPAYRTAIESRRSVLAKGASVGNFEIEVQPPGSDKVIPVEISSVPIVFNRNHAVLTIVRDINERKFLARRLIETIIQTEETERSRIARDLHDEIGPLLSALKIYTTAFIENKIPEKRDHLADNIGSIIRDLIDSVKDISNDMSPHILDNFGITAAIQNISDLFSRDLAISVKSEIGKLRFPEIAESVIFRVVKELVNNTIKHARAKEVLIRLDYDGKMLHCDYRDDGIGFDLETFQNSSAKGMGLGNIKTRIQSLGGMYDIQTHPGKGFQISVYLKTTPLGNLR
jgi:PAS domain S-box-containing protein